MDAPKTQAVVPDTPNPLEGQGGSFYINPKGSNTLKRDRNFDVPFDALSRLEKHARISAIPLAHISDRDRAVRIGAIGLTADELKTLSPAAAEQAVAAASGVSAVAEAALVTSTTKAKGVK